MIESRRHPVATPANRRALLVLISVVSILNAESSLLAQAASRANVLTYHNDLARSGQNLNETILTPANVNMRDFGQLFSRAVDGYVYAQPLYLSDVAIPGRGTHNVVFVATEHDSVYAFDADSNLGDNAAPLWKVSFIDPAAGITTVPIGDFGLNDPPEIGITGTPVIDPQTRTLFVVARLKTFSGFPPRYEHRLYALDAGTGATKFDGPVVIRASVPGSGDASDSQGSVSLDSYYEFQRPGLLLLNDVVYVTFASQGDMAPYHGWIIGYDAHTLQQRSVYNSTPDGSAGGIWMSGAAPAADAAGNIYCMTGNGTFDAESGGPDYGDSFLKLTPDGASLAVTDYFTPYDQHFLDVNDGDLGSGAPMLLPDSVGNADHPHLLVGCGKGATIYLIDRDQMGHFDPEDNSQIVQSLPGAIQGTWSMPAYFNGWIYYQAYGDYLKAFRISQAELSSSPVSQATNVFEYPGATPSISASGTNHAIIWTIQADAFSKGGGPAVLHAYNATNLVNELYTSGQAGIRDQMGLAQKFSVPTIANGKVYVGTGFGLSVFGLLAAPVIVTQPQDQSVEAGTEVKLSVTATGSGPLTYQWFKDGAPVPGATNSALALAYVQESNAGHYAVTVRNLAGPAASTLAVVTVRPVISKARYEPATGFQFHLDVPSGKQATVQMSSDLINWINVRSSPVTGIDDIQDPSAATHRWQFYRVIVE